MDWVKKQFALLRDFYQREFWSSVRMLALAFAAILVLAFLASLIFKDAAGRIIQVYAAAVSESGLIGEDGSISALAVFGNNVRATLLTVAMGFVPYLYLPALPLGTNAGILGLFGGYYVSSGHTILAYLAGVIPHGIFELPALVLSLTIGITLCRSLVDYMRNNPKGVMKPLLLNMARVYVLNVVPLLFVASFIEVYITPSVMGLFL